MDPSYKNSPRNPDTNSPLRGVYWGVPTHVPPQNQTSNSPTTTLLRTRTKLFSNALYNFTKMPLPLYEKICVSTTLTHSPLTRTNSNKRQTTLSNHKRKKNRTNWWPTFHATMEMMVCLQDKILALCGIISENR